MSKEMMDVLAYEGFVDPIKIQVSDREVLCGEARMAQQLLEKWGLVAGEIDGEDSAGRSKMRRLTPDELVAHATATASLAYSEFRARGWVKTIPSYAELQNMAAKTESEKPDDKLGNRKRFLGIF